MPRELRGLSEPVRDYRTAVLDESQPIIAAATVGLAGTIHMSATAEQWRPSSLRQRLVTSAAGRKPRLHWVGHDDEVMGAIRTLVIQAGRP